jgi:hypothetical protein
VIEMKVRVEISMETPERTDEPIDQADLEVLFHLLHLLADFTVPNSGLTHTFEICFKNDFTV